MSVLRIVNDKIIHESPITRKRAQAELRASDTYRKEIEYVFDFTTMKMKEVIHWVERDTGIEHTED